MKLKLALAAVLVMAATVMANAATQTFPNPKTAPGLRLDWCYLWATQCGQPAANAFCQTKGFNNALSFDKAPGIGATGPTQVIGSGQICAAPNCDGFAQVTCTKPDLTPPPPPPPPAPPPGPPPGPGDGAGPSKTYFSPNLAGKRINYCLSAGLGCGQDAADAYCSAKGWNGADDFTQSDPLPSGSTRYISNGKKCKGGSCTGFDDITCSDN